MPEPNYQSKGLLEFDGTLTCDEIFANTNIAVHRDARMPTFHFSPSGLLRANSTLHMRRGTLTKEGNVVIINEFAILKIGVPDGATAADSVIINPSIWNYGTINILGPHTDMSLPDEQRAKVQMNVTENRKYSAQCGKIVVDIQADLLLTGFHVKNEYLMTAHIAGGAVLYANGSYDGYAGAQLIIESGAMELSSGYVFSNSTVQGLLFNSSDSFLRLNNSGYLFMDGQFDEPVYIVVGNASRLSGNGLNVTNSQSTLTMHAGSSLNYNWGNLRPIDWHGDITIGDENADAATESEPQWTFRMSALLKSFGNVRVFVPKSVGLTESPVIWLPNRYSYWENHGVMEIYVAGDLHVDQDRSVYGYGDAIGLINYGQMTVYGTNDTEVRTSVPVKGEENSHLRLEDGVLFVQRGAEWRANSLSMTVDGLVRLRANDVRMHGTFDGVVNLEVRHRGSIVGFSAVFTNPLSHFAFLAGRIGGSALEWRGSMTMGIAGSTYIWYLPYAEQIEYNVEIGCVLKTYGHTQVLGPYSDESLNQNTQYHILFKRGTWLNYGLLEIDVNQHLAFKQDSTYPEAQYGLLHAGEMVVRSAVGAKVTLLSPFNCTSESTLVADNAVLVLAYTLHPLVFAAPDLSTSSDGLLRVENATLDVTGTATSVLNVEVARGAVFGRSGTFVGMHLLSRFTLSGGAIGDALDGQVTFAVDWHGVFALGTSAGVDSFTLAASLTTHAGVAWWSSTNYYYPYHLKMFIIDDVKGKWINKGQCDVYPSQVPAPYDAHLIVESGAPEAIVNEGSIVLEHLDVFVHFRCNVRNGPGAEIRASDGEFVIEGRFEVQSGGELDGAFAVLDGGALDVSGTISNAVNIRVDGGALENGAAAAFTHADSALTVVRGRVGSGVTGAPIDWHGNATWGKTGQVYSSLSDYNVYLNAPFVVAPNALLSIVGPYTDMSAAPSSRVGIRFGAQGALLVNGGAMKTTTTAWGLEFAADSFGSNHGRIELSNGGTYTSFGGEVWLNVPFNVLDESSSVSVYAYYLHVNNTAVLASKLVATENELAAIVVDVGGDLTVPAGEYATRVDLRVFGGKFRAVGESPAKFTHASALFVVAGGLIGAADETETPVAIDWAGLFFTATMAANLTIGTDFLVRGVAKIGDPSSPQSVVFCEATTLTFASTVTSQVCWRLSSGDRTWTTVSGALFARVVACKEIDWCSSYQVAPPLLIADNIKLAGNFIGKVWQNGLSPPSNTGELLVHANGTCSSSLPYLLAHYKLLGDFESELANGTTGVPTGAATFDSEAGVALNGQNEAVSFPSMPLAEPDVHLSVLAWIKATSFAEDAAILAKGSTAMPYALQLTTGGAVKFTGNFGAPAEGLGSGSVTSSGTVPLGAWMHVAVTFDAHRVRFYINGLFDSEAAATYYFGQLPDEELWVGVNQGGGGGAYFHGSMFDVRLYSVALSAAEVKAARDDNLYMPTLAPTDAPSRSPTKAPTSSPTTKPTPRPSRSPTALPTALPTHSPTRRPTQLPSSAPTSQPTHPPSVTTSVPTTSSASTSMTNALTVTAKTESDESTLPSTPSMPSTGTTGVSVSSVVNTNNTNTNAASSTVNTASQASATASIGASSASVVATTPTHVQSLEANATSAVVSATADSTESATTEQRPTKGAFGVKETDDVGLFDAIGGLPTFVGIVAGALICCILLSLLCCFVMRRSSASERRSSRRHSALHQRSGGSGHSRGARSRGQSRGQSRRQSRVHQNSFNTSHASSRLDALMPGVPMRAIPSGASRAASSMSSKSRRSRPQSRSFVPLPAPAGVTNVNVARQEETGAAVVTQAVNSINQNPIAVQNSASTITPSAREGSVETSTFGGGTGEFGRSPPPQPPPKPPRTINTMSTMSSIGTVNVE